MRSQRLSLKVKGGGRTVTPLQAMYELKHRVVLSLNKLADRDTYQIGADELEKIAEGLTPDGILPFLSCIIDTDSEQKSAVRKECIKSLGTLAKFHGSLMYAHIGKMVTSIVKRLKDSDSSVRDACVETSGVLALTMGRSGGGENGFVALVKPFFEAMGEQNRYVQVGSALCLSRVIDEAREPPTSLLAQILTRVVKLLKNQHFMAKPAVIELIRSIVQAGGASTENAMQLAVTSLTDALKCNDWTTRKAASLALAAIAGRAGPALGYLKDPCISSLESCRFDKVKPVRDAVVHALQCWKALPANESCGPSEAGSSTKDIINEDYTDLTCTINGGWSHSSNKTTSISTQSGTSTISTKKRTPLTIIKNLPNQIHSYQQYDSNESQKSTVQKKFQKNENATRDWFYEGGRIEDKADSSDSSFVNDSCETKHVATNNEYVDDGSSVNIISVNSGPAAEEINSEGFRVFIGRDEGLHGLRECCLTVSKELTFIREQLMGIKTEQSKLLNLLEAFMVNTTSNLSTLHLKINNLDSAINEISQIFTQKENFFNIGKVNLSNKSSNPSSSPLPSTCTPRSSFHHRSLSTLSSSTRIHSFNQKPLSRAPSINSTREEGLDPWLDLTMVRNPEEMEVQRKIGRSQLKETEQKSFENEAISWKKMMSDSNRDVESAYEEALSYGGDDRLLELMKMTGPVLEKLSGEVAGKVLVVLSKKLLNHSFMPLMIPWLQQVVDLSILQGGRQPFLSKKEQMEFLCALKGMEEVEYIDLHYRVSISQFAAKLNKAWAEAACRRIPLPRDHNGTIMHGKNA